MIDNEVVKYYENYREEDRITTNNARKIEFLTTIRKFDEVFKEKYEDRKSTRLNSSHTS